MRKISFSSPSVRECGLLSLVSHFGHIVLMKLVETVHFPSLVWKTEEHPEVQNFVEGVTFPCFAMVRVRRKLYNKIQLNIQYTLYQLSDRVDKREESQEIS